MKRLRVEPLRHRGALSFGLEVWGRLGFSVFLEKVMAQGWEEITWSMTESILALMRLCEPSSAFEIAEHLDDRNPRG